MNEKGGIVVLKRETERLAQPISMYPSPHVSRGHSIPCPQAHSRRPIMSFLWPTSPKSHSTGVGAVLSPDSRAHP